MLLYSGKEILLTLVFKCIFVLVYANLFIRANKNIRFQVVFTWFSRGIVVYLLLRELRSCVNYLQ